MAIVKTSIALIKRYPVLSYFLLTFAISWGGFVLVVGPGGFPGTGSQFDTITPYVVIAMLAGPSISGLVLTGVVCGRAGYRELLSRLLRWRVGARWYAVALLTAPLLAWALLAAFSLTPPIFSTADKAALVLTSVVAGLVGGLFEELGWTGFAVPRLRLRHGVLATGLIIGVPWGAWHLLQGLWIGGTYAGTVPLGLFLILNFLSGIAELTAFRVLMMWVYDRTESLLIAALMHAGLITGTIFLFTPMATGMLGLAYAWTFNAALWLLVAVVVVANQGHLARQPIARPVL
ncbi:MAG TPA: CPBP family intramembrane glutamic endopeptidase [Roseiflexaceae bacterium]|nr:CPBP family intramembrane glutamic endopeptidase [Roseiflexaceae bacterium]